MSAAPVLPLTTIGIIILIAIIFSIFIKKLKQNETIGFILTGFLLGPFLLHFLSPEDPLVMGFAELGLFVLLFYLGVELSLKEFLAAGSTIFGLAVVDMLMTVGFGFITLILFGYSLMFAVVVGIMMFCTSTAIVAKFIIDRSLFHTPAAKIVISIAILQDFLGIILLVIVTSSASAGGSGSSVLALAFAALVFAVAAFYAVSHLSKIVERWMSSNGFGHTEMTLYALGTGLLVATMGSLLGLSTAIGAYFAGFALSETHSGHKIKKDVGFLRDFFLVFFFVAFGTTMFYDSAAKMVVLPSAAEFAYILGLAVLLGGLAILAHSISMRIFGAMFGLSADDATLAGVLLSPLGEFVVIIATVTAGTFAGMEAKLISPLAFLIILVTVFAFMPLYNNRSLHQKIFSRIPMLPKPTPKTQIVPETPYTTKQIKDIALNIFVTICFAWVAILLYKDLPRFGVPVIYSRQITTFLIFLFFASVPIFNALRALKRLFKQIRIDARKAKKLAET